MNYAEELHQIGLLREAGHFDAVHTRVKQVREKAQQDNAKDVLVALGQEDASAFKHEFWQTQNSEFLNQAWRSLEEISELVSDSTRATYCFWRGEILLLQQKFPIAVQAFQTAVESLAEDAWHRGDFQYHLGLAQYLAGQKQQGLANVYQGIEEIQRRQGDIPEYIYKVWLSGGYLRLAQLLKLEKRPKEAQQYWNLARDIIVTDERLVLRMGHLGKVRQFLQQRDPQISNVL